MLKLLIDHREIKIKQSMENLKEFNYEFKSLDLGDIIFKNDDDIILIIGIILVTTILL